MLRGEKYVKNACCARSVQVAHCLFASGLSRSRGACKDTNDHHRGHTADGVVGESDQGVFIPEINKRLAASGKDFRIEWNEAWSGTVAKLTEVFTTVSEGVAQLGIPVWAFEGSKLPLEGITFNVPFGIAASSALSNIKAGRVKSIAVQAPRRIPLGPDWPTVAEAGMPGFEASNWTALVAPAGTPSNILAKINADANRALKMPDVVERLSKAGSEPVGFTPEELAAKMQAESERYVKLIRDINLKRD